MEMPFLGNRRTDSGDPRGKRSAPKAPPWTAILAEGQRPRRPQSAKNAFLPGVRCTRTPPRRVGEMAEGHFPCADRARVSVYLSRNAGKVKRRPRSGLRKSVKKRENHGDGSGRSWTQKKRNEKTISCVVQRTTDAKLFSLYDAPFRRYG